MPHIVAAAGNIRRLFADPPLLPEQRPPGLASPASGVGIGRLL
jgi:hypothetical protein